MKHETVDYLLRSAWTAIAKMYGEEAGKKGSTMATGFALLSIDPEEGTPSTSLGPKMGMEATSLSRTLKRMEEKNKALVLLHSPYICFSHRSFLHRPFLSAVPLRPSTLSQLPNPSSPLPPRVRRPRLRPCQRLQ